MGRKTNDPSGELIDHDHHPVAFDGQRFTSEQVNTPQTVFRVPKECEPRRPLRTRGWLVMLG